MDNLLDLLRQDLIDLESFNNKVRYHKDDIRKCYYNLTGNNLATYYRSCCFLILAIDLSNKKVDFNKGHILSQQHINALSLIHTSDLSFEDYRNSINRTIVFDTFSIFEFCISVILENILPNEELKRFTGKGRHISIVRLKTKWLKIFEIVQSDYLNGIEEDKEFLNFYAAYRNSLHANGFFYHKKRFEYNFENVGILFEYGKPIRYNNEFGLDWHFKLGLRLMEIFTKLVDSLDYNDIIPYPNDILKE